MDTYILAQFIVQCLPPEPWVTPFSVSDQAIGHLVATTSGQGGIQWYWTPPEEMMPLEIMDHGRTVLDPASLGCCLSQMAVLRPKLAVLYNDIIELLEN